MNAPAVRPAAVPASALSTAATAYDVEAMLFGFRLCRKLAEQPALKPYIAEEAVPGASVSSEADLIEDLRNRGVSNLHPVGTCRMGTGADAVVEAPGTGRHAAAVALRAITGASVLSHINGIKGLRVADASIMPQVVGGNTNAPSIMIGEKCAAMVLEDGRAS